MYIIPLGRYECNYIPPAMGKIVGQTGHFNLAMATSLVERNSEFMPIKLFLKVHLVSHSTRGDGVSKYIY